MFLYVFLDWGKDFDCSDTKLEEEERNIVLFHYDPSYVFMGLNKKELQAIMERYISHTHDLRPWLSWFLQQDVHSSHLYS